MKIIHHFFIDTFAPFGALYCKVYDVFSLAMNSISIGHAGNQSYYLKLGKEDYYTSSLDPSGIFKGEGARRLGIENEKIEKGDIRLKNLFLGRSPDGQECLRQGVNQIRMYKYWQHEDKETGKITRFKSEKSVPLHLKDKVTLHTEKRRSVLCYDNVFSPPKDVSIVWSLAPTDRKRERIHELHNRAVMEAVKYLEDNACFVRTGRGGSSREKAEAIFAVFHHTTSRELDPQLHSHAVLLNTGFSKSGKALSLDGRDILEHRYASGMVYQNSLRAALEREFNIRTYDRPFSDGKGVSFGIFGISPEVRLEFSKRSEQILERITSDMSPLKVRKEVLASRKEKNFEIETKDLLLDWRERGERSGFSWGEVTVRKEPKPRKPKDLELHKDTATFLQENSYNQKKARNKGQISTAQILVATLSASKGKHENQEAFQKATDFKDKFTDNKNLNLFRLNGSGRKLINFRKIAERLWRTAKTVIASAYEWSKDQRRKVLINSKSKVKSQKLYKFKMLYLYSTGKITRKQYLKFTTHKPFPTGYFKIHIYEALGIISTRKAYCLLNRYHANRFWGKGNSFERKLNSTEPFNCKNNYKQNDTQEKENREKYNTKENDSHNSR